MSLCISIFGKHPRSVKKMPGYAKSYCQQIKTPLFKLEYTSFSIFFTLTRLSLTTYCSPEHLFHIL